MRYLFAVLMAASLTGCATITTQNKIDVVKIDADGNTYLNGEQTSIASLSESFSKNVVIIESDRSTPYEKIISVLDETREAGIAQVSLKTQDKMK